MNASLRKRFSDGGHSSSTGSLPNSLMKTTELLIIGAGPFGLAVAAHAKLSGIAVTIVGEPMAFWKHNMPAGMLPAPLRDRRPDGSDMWVRFFSALPLRRHSQ